MKLKKSMKRVLIILGIIVAIGGGVLIYNSFNGKNKSGNSVTIISHIKEYGYQLNSNESSLYKDLFKDLDQLLSKDEHDEKEYVTLITKLFVADFYNLSNKLTSLDVGGLQFVHKDIRDNFSLNASNTFYQYIESNIYGDRKQELPEVTDVTVNEIKNESYTYNKVTDKNAYVVSASWVYKKELGYTKSKTFIFVHEDKKLSLVEIK